MLKMIMGNESVRSLSIRVNNKQQVKRFNMLNIGLEVLNGRTNTAASAEDILNAYVDCESFFSASDNMTAYADQLFTAFENLLSLGKTAMKFKGSNEALSVINALVKEDFGGKFSMEAVAGYTDTVWGRIKAFFAKIWNWIKMFFQRIISIFANAETRLAKLEGKLNSFDKGEMREWRYIGLPDAKLISIETDFRSFESALRTADDKEKVGNALAEAFKGTESDRDSGMNAQASFGKSILVTSVDKAKGLIKNVRLAFGKVRNLQSDVTKSYNDRKKVVDNLMKEDKPDADAVKAANLEVYKVNTQTKYLTKLGKLITRSAMSILANCKVAAKKED